MSDDTQVLKIAFIDAHPSVSSIDIEPLFTVRQSDGELIQSNYYLAHVRFTKQPWLEGVAATPKRALREVAKQMQSSWGDNIDVWDKI